MPPTLSIVIPSHNRPDLLERCLASVLKYAPPWAEILVVDDASEQAVDSTGDLYHPVGIARKRGHGETLRDEHIWGVFGASGSSSFFHREALHLACAFPEELVAYFDDVDLSFRLHRAGYRIRYEPGSRVYHRVSSSYGNPRRDLLALQSRNEELVFWRNLPPGMILRWLPAHLAVVVAKSVRRAWAGELGPFLRGRLAALRQMPAVVRHRRRLAKMELGARYVGVPRLRRELPREMIVP